LDESINNDNSKPSTTEFELFDVYKEIKLEEYRKIFDTPQLSLYITIFFVVSYLGVDFNNFQIFLKSNIDP